MTRDDIGRPLAHGLFAVSQLNAQLGASFHRLEIVRSFAEVERRSRIPGRIRVCRVIHDVESVKNATNFRIIVCYKFIQQLAAQQEIAR